jgi:tetratricopeptide (TPR) repeat protein
VSVYFALGQANALAEQRRDNHDFGAAAYFINNQFFKPLAFGSTEPEYLRTAFDIATERIDRDLGTSPRGEAHMRHIFGIVYTWRFHDYDVAISSLERAIELHQRDRPPNGQRNWLGLALLKAGRYQAAEAAFSEAVETEKEHWEQTAGMLPPGTFYHVLRCHLGETYRLLGLYDEAERHLRAALDDVPWNKDNSPGLFYRGMLANALRDGGHYEEAERLYDEILRTNRDVGYVNYDRKLKDVTGATSTAILDLGILYMLQGNLDEAAPLVEEALDKAQKVYGEEDPRTVDVKIALAVLHARQGRHEKAESLFDESLKNIQARLKDDHPELLRARNHLGVLYREQGRHDEAEKLLNEVIESQSEKLGPDHPRTLESMHELALVYVATEDYDKAEPLLLDAVRGREAKLGPEHPHTIDSLRELVNLYESWFKPDDAEKWRAKLPHGKATEE